MRMVEESEGEITPEIDEALTLTQDQLRDAALNIGFVIKDLEYSAEVVEAEMSRLSELKSKITKGKELLKNRLSESMQLFGIERIESPTLKLSFRKSEAVEISDEQEIPAAYLNHPPPKPDKTKIKEAIKSGEPVPGAQLVERKNLQIK